MPRALLLLIGRLQANGCVRGNPFIIYDPPILKFRYIVSGLLDCKNLSASKRGEGLRHHEFILGAGVSKPCEAVLTLYTTVFVPGGSGLYMYGCGSSAGMVLYTTRVTMAGNR